MNIVTRFWGWAVLVAGLGLVALAWAPPALADHPQPGPPEPIDDSLVTQQYCEDPGNFGHLTPRQQALCGAGAPGDGGGLSISVLIQRVVSVLSYVVGVAALIVVLVQGLRMILSSGESSAITSARNGIIYALVGLAIAIAAPHLVGYILTLIGNPPADPETVEATARLFSI